MSPCDMGSWDYTITIQGCITVSAIRIGKCDCVRVPVRLWATWDVDRMRCGSHEMWDVDHMRCEMWITWDVDHMRCGSHEMWDVGHMRFGSHEMWITRWYIGLSAGAGETHLPPPLRDSPAVVEQRQSPLVAERRGESGTWASGCNCLGVFHSWTTIQAQPCSGALCSVGTLLGGCVLAGTCTMLCEDTTGWVCACRE